MMLRISYATAEMVFILRIAKTDPVMLCSSVHIPTAYLYIEFAMGIQTVYLVRMKTTVFYQFHVQAISDVEMGIASVRNIFVTVFLNVKTMKMKNYVMWENVQ